MSTTPPTDIQFKQFAKDGWDSITEWARDVTQRLNDRGIGLSVWGVSGVRSSVRADIVGTASMPLRVSDDGTTLAFGPLSAPSRGVTPIASAYCSTAQVIPTGAVTVALIDTLDFADTVSSYVVTDLTTQRVTVLQAGYYRVRVRIGMTPAGVGRVAALIAKNGNLAVNEAQSSVPCVAAQAVAVEAAPILRLAANDYVQVCAFQNTGAGVALSTSMSQRAQIQVDYMGSL